MAELCYFETIVAFDYDGLIYYFQYHVAMLVSVAHPCQVAHLAENHSSAPGIKGRQKDHRKLKDHVYLLDDLHDHNLTYIVQNTVQRNLMLSWLSASIYVIVLVFWLWFYIQFSVIFLRARHANGQDFNC